MLGTRVRKILGLGAFDHADDLDEPPLWWISVGQEGVTVQIRATLSHRFARHIKIPDASRIFLMTGMAAGLQVSFRRHALRDEVSTVGELQLMALYPALIASIVASFTSHALGLSFAVPRNN